MRQGCLLTASVQCCTGSTSQWNKKQNRYKVCKGGSERPLSTEVMFVYLEKTKESIDKPIGLLGIVSHWIQDQCKNINCISI